MKPIFLPDGGNALAGKASSLLFLISLSFQKWLFSQTLWWLLKSALFVCFLESNQLVCENHLPLSGQQWLLQPPLCQVEFKRRWSLPLPKGQKAPKARFLNCLTYRCLPSFSRKCTKWPFLTGNFQECWSGQLLICSSYLLCCSTLYCKVQRPMSLVKVAAGSSGIGWCWIGLATKEGSPGPHTHIYLAGWGHMVVTSHQIQNQNIAQGALFMSSVNWRQMLSTDGPWLMTFRLYDGTW